MQFPLPGQLPGASRKVMFAFGMLHTLCAISLVYPYLGAFALMIPLAVILFLLRQRIPAEAQMAYRFLIQRMLLIAAVLLLYLILELQTGLQVWVAIYFTLLPLCIADTTQAFRGGVGLFYVRGRDA